MGTPSATPHQWAVFLCTFLAFLSYAVLIPSLPELLGVKSLGPRVYGTLQSVGNLFGMIGATMLGSLSDQIGRRSVIISCFVLAFSGSLLLAGREVWTLLPIAGLLMRRIDRSASSAVMKAYVVDTVPDDASSCQAVLAQNQMCMGLGFAVGSSFGGYLSAYGCTTVATTAALLAAAAAVIAATVLKPVQPHKEQVTVRKMQGWYTDHAVVGLLLVRALIGAAFHLVTSTSDLYYRDRFSLTPAQFGYLLSYIGICFTLVNGILVPPLARRFATWPLFFSGVLTLGISRIALALAQTVPQTLCADVLVAVGSAICGSTGTSLLADAAGPEHTGFLLGMSESAQALAGVASPAFAGFLYEAYGSSAPCLAASMCCVLAAIVFATLVPNHTKSDDTRICNEKPKVKAA